MITNMHLLCFVQFIYSDKANGVAVALFHWLTKSHILHNKHQLVGSFGCNTMAADKSLEWMVQ